MPGTLIRRRNLVVAVVAAAGMLGACGLIDRPDNASCGSMCLLVD